MTITRHRQNTGYKAGSHQIFWCVYSNLGPEDKIGSNDEPKRIQTNTKVPSPTVSLRHNLATIVHCCSMVPAISSPGEIL